MIQPIDKINWNQEKQKLIQKIVESKAEHQQTILQLKQKSSECDMLVSEKVSTDKLHSDEMDRISTQFNALQIETSNLKTQYTRKESENLSLSHENEVLKARLKQLEASQQQTTSANETVREDTNNQPDEYQMEKIIDHKKKKDGLHLRVRWKNYTAKDDTWEPESNLMCSLCEYKQKMNLK